MKNQTHLFSIGEAASMCGVCVGTIRRWCRSGKLHETFRTFGNQRRFSFEDLKNGSQSTNFRLWRLISMVIQPIEISIGEGAIFGVVLF